MGKFPEAQARLLDNIFVCRRCKTKIKSSMLRILAGKIRCRNCQSRTLRPAKKK